MALLALSVSGFIAIITETMPAGLLPQISEGLGVSQAYAGQFISTYALGSVLAAIPIISMTRNWDRKPLLLMAIAGFFLFNLATFLLHNYIILLAIRFLAGVSAGIIWGSLTGYTVRLVSVENVGKSLAIVGVGQPIALSLGVPLATWLGNIIGWNTVFFIASILSLLLIFWIVIFVPNVSIENKTKSVPFKTVFSNKSIQKILMATLFWILSHNLLYTYISPFLEASKLSDQLDIMLFLFGISSIVGIWLTGHFIDRHLKRVTLINLILFGIAGVLMLFGNTHSAFIYIGITLWGYSFGGAPTLLQKDLADVAKDHVDIAQSMFVTVFNIAVAGGGVFGGLLLAHLGVQFIVILFIILAISTLFLSFGRKPTKAK